MSFGTWSQTWLGPKGLWLRCRPAAIALIQSQPLAWELPYASGEDLKRKNKQQQQQTSKQKKQRDIWVIEPIVAAVHQLILGHLHPGKPAEICAFKSPSRKGSKWLCKATKTDWPGAVTGNSDKEEGVTI